MEVEADVLVIGMWAEDCRKWIKMIIILRLITAVPSQGTQNNDLILFPDSSSLSNLVSV